MTARVVIDLGSGITQNGILQLYATAGLDLISGSVVSIGSGLTDSNGAPLTTNEFSGSTSFTTPGQPNIYTFTFPTYIVGATPSGTTTQIAFDVVAVVDNSVTVGQNLTLTGKLSYTNQFLSGNFSALSFVVVSPSLNLTMSTAPAIAAANTLEAFHVQVINPSNGSAAAYNLIVTCNMTIPMAAISSTIQTNDPSAQIYSASTPISQVVIKSAQLNPGNILTINFSAHFTSSVSSLEKFASACAVVYNTSACNQANFDPNSYLAGPANTVVQIHGPTVQVQFLANNQSTTTVLPGDTITTVVTTTFYNSVTPNFVLNVTLPTGFKPTGISGRSLIPNSLTFLNSSYPIITQTPTGYIIQFGNVSTTNTQAQYQFSIPGVIQKNISSVLPGSNLTFQATGTIQNAIVANQTGTLAVVGGPNLNIQQTVQISGNVAQYLITITNPNGKGVGPAYNVQLTRTLDPALLRLLSVNVHTVPNLLPQDLSKIAKNLVSVTIPEIPVGSQVEILYEANILNGKPLSTSQGPVTISYYKSAVNTNTFVQNTLLPPTVFNGKAMNKPKPKAKGKAKAKAKAMKGKAKAMKGKAMQKTKSIESESELPHSWIPSTKTISEPSTKTISEPSTKTMNTMSPKNMKQKRKQIMNNLTETRSKQRKTKNMNTMSPKNMKHKNMNKFN